MEVSYKYLSEWAPKWTGYIEKSICSRGKLFSSHLGSSASLIIKLTENRLTGEKQIIYGWQPQRHERDPKTARKLRLRRRGKGSRASKETTIHRKKRRTDV